MSVISGEVSGANNNYNDKLTAKKRKTPPTKASSQISKIPKTEQIQSSTQPVITQEVKSEPSLDDKLQFLEKYLNFSKRFKIDENNNIISKKYNRNLGTIDDLYKITEIFHKLSTTTMGKKWVIKGTKHNLIGTLKSKDDKVSLKIYVIGNEVKTAGGIGEIRFGVKVSTGKAVVAKSIKTGKSSKLSRENEKIESVNVKVTENLSKIKESFPKALIEVKNTENVVVVLPNPTLPAKGSDSYLVMDKYEGDGSSYIYENAKYAELKKEYEELRSEKPRSVRGKLFLTKRTDDLTRKYIEAINTIPISEEIFRFCRDEVMAVAIFHMIDFTHGDLKPKNFFVNDVNGQKRAVLADYDGIKQLLNPKKEPNLTPKEQSHPIPSYTPNFTQLRMLGEVRRNAGLGGREAYNAALIKMDKGSLGMVLYMHLTGDLVPGTMKQLITPKKNFSARVVDEEAAFNNPAFVVLPDDIKMMLTRLIKGDDTYSLNDAYNTLSAYIKS